MPTPYRPTLLDVTDPDHQRIVDELRSDARIEVIDRFDDQLATLLSLRPAPEPDLLAEPRRWVYYPWRRSLVSVLGPRAYRRARLDRNRNLITLEEHDRLAGLRIGVVGLSVGHVIAHTLAAQGVLGRLRLADFDELEVSNLNRVPATVFDLGVNKATVAARRIAELDPFMDVEVWDGGLTPDTVDEFLDDVNIVVEECDSLDIKALVREVARARRLPVLMATSDRGLVDVERFDLEPTRPVFHGVLGDLDVATLAGLSSQEKLPYVLRLIDAGSLSARGAASLVEVGHTLSTWPQLAGDVAVGATAIAEAVRRIGVGELLSSGRVRLDAASALDGVLDPVTAATETRHEEAADDAGAAEPTDVRSAVVAAAVRAPSGGNAQPWHIEETADGVVIRLAPEYKSTLDVAHRGSAVAVGAAVFNARVAAAANGAVGAVEVTQSDDGLPLRATVRLSRGEDPALGRLYSSMMARETNRRHGTPAPISADAQEEMRAAARDEDAGLHLLIERAEIEEAAVILAAADRIRYLTPHLHADMTSELRWPGRGSLESGIDVRSLELKPGQLLTLDILRRPEVMTILAGWDAGAALGADTITRTTSSATLGVVTVSGRSLADYARGGSAAEAVWITAHEHGLAVQPISPVFLYAQTDDDLHDLSPAFADTLRGLQRRFRQLARTGDDESQVLVLRLSHAPPASVRSRRRPVNGVAAALP